MTKVGLGVLVTEMELDGVAFTVAVEVAEIAVSVPGGVPLAVPVSVNDPASILACVTV